MTNFYDFRFKWTVTAGIGMHPIKALLSPLVNFKNAIWTLEERYAIKFCFKLGKMPCYKSWIHCYDPETKRQSSQWKHAGSRRPRGPDRANTPTNFCWFLFLTALESSTCTGFTLDSQQWILCWGFKGVQEEIPREEASTLQIRSVAFPPGQCTSPQLPPYHRLFDQDGHQDSSLPSL